jgi:hypothetical protein
MTNEQLRAIRIAVDEATWLASGPYSICHCWPVID